MAEAGDVGAIAELWRFPVKSMGGERLETADVTADGIVGDRAYALIDEATGDVVSGKNVKNFPDVMRCAAAFVSPPEAGRPAPPVEIHLGDGHRVASEDSEADAVLSAYFGRQVRLARAAPLGGDDKAPSPDRAIADRRQRRFAEVLKALGFERLAPASAFVDLFQASLITRSTLRHLGELAPESRFDPRRFRMNVVLETDAEGFVEDGWIGRRLAFGSGVALEVVAPDPRCVMTTLPQDDLPADEAVLRTLETHNTRTLAGQTFPCAGVYAVVAAPGTLRTGEAVLVS